MQTQSVHLVFWKNDPLLYVLKEKLHLSDLGIILLLIVLAACAMFGLGWIADSSYTGQGMRFLDPTFYSSALVLVFVLGPLLLGFYVWQPGAIAEVLQNLERTDVIRQVSDRGSKSIKSYPSFLIKFQKAVDNKAWAIVAIVLAVSFWALEFLVAPAILFRTPGKTAFWYDTKWFMVVLASVICGGLYVSGMIALKQVQAILYFNRLLQWFDVTVHPMHPDEAGGLGALGDFTLKTSLIAVGIGIGAAIFTGIDTIAGSNPLTRPDLVGFWVIYLVGTPASLILPMLSAHHAMQIIRNEKLDEIAREFEKTLSDVSVIRSGDAEALKKANERLQELQTRYDLVAESLPTWPIPARLFRNFSITASLPLLSGLVSMVINFATK